MVHSAIKGSGSYLPARIVPNAELAAKVETTDEWITSRTGIRQRHIAEDGETTSQMAANAGKAAIAKAGLSANDIDLIIVATTTPEKSFPATAAITQSLLGIKNAAAFDVQAVCAGFVYALSVADSMIKSGNFRNALVIGADKMSSLVDWNDRGTCILFGDGAGAVVLSASEKPGGVLGFDLHTDGDFRDILYANSGEKLVMHGKEVFKHAVEKMGGSLLNLLNKCNIAANDVDWLVPHQANERIIDTLAEKLHFPAGKIIKTVGSHANTSAASIPLALDNAFNSGSIKAGNLVAITAIGGGLSWGSCIFRI